MQSTGNPGLMLLAGLGVLLLFCLLFWPNVGLLSWWKRSRRATERVLLEDALKFLFDCKYKNLPCDMNTLQGHLNISTHKVTKLLEHLTSIGLMEMDNGSFRLTDAGRSYALRIIRVHRVWEKYLSEETGVAPLEWHGQADQVEHYLSEEATEQLAMKIGNPLVDPHGDPIPSAFGDIPDHDGQPMSTLKKGDIAVIVHIEDEPTIIFEQLVALGLYPGMQVYILDDSDNRIRFAANGDECSLTTFFASSITVRRLPSEEPLQEKSDLLSSLKLGDKAVVKGISPYCRGRQRRRLMDLGIVPGTVVTARLRSASGNPIAYEVMDAAIAIRKEQADLIFVKPLNKEA